LIKWRIHNPGRSKTLVYLPGLHGDWTLLGRFRLALAGRATLVELAYPRDVFWSLEEHAAGVVDALREAGVGKGWLLAESFGSQVAWALLRLLEQGLGKGFEGEGLILAGGFVRHPWPWSLQPSRRLLGSRSSRLIGKGVRFWARHVWFRNCDDPEMLADARAFLSRQGGTGRGMGRHRLQLIAQADWRAEASKARLPVYYLTGLFDPIVPWPWVVWWLKRSCPSLRGTRIVFFCDHHVLGTAAGKAADQIMRWVEGGEAPPALQKSRVPLE